MPCCRLPAAGYAPLYHERDLDSVDMAAVREALKLTLPHHEPLPALVVNRQWSMVMSNPAATRILGPARWCSAALTLPPPPVLPLHFDNGRESFSLFSMLSTFGTAQDVTADELRVETFFPADEATARLFQLPGT